METDYEREAENQMRFRRLLQDDDHYHIPRVFPQHSTKKVLVSEFASGVPIDTLASADQETRNWVRNGGVSSAMMSI